MCLLQSSWTLYPFIFQKNPLKQWKNNKRTFTCHNKVVWVWNRKFSECTRIQCYEQKKMIISWMQFGQQEIIWSFGTLLVPLPNLLLQHNGGKSFLKKHLLFFSAMSLPRTFKDLNSSFLPSSCITPKPGLKHNFLSYFIFN